MEKKRFLGGSTEPPNNQYFCARSNGRMILIDCVRAVTALLSSGLNLTYKVAGDDEVANQAPAPAFTVPKNIPVNIPKPLSLEGNIHSNWTKFVRIFKVYLGAVGLDPSPVVLQKMSAEEKANLSEVKAQTLLNVAGAEVIDLSRTFNSTDEQAQDYEKLVSALTEYASPKLKQLTSKIKETVNQFKWRQLLEDLGIQESQAP